MAITTVDRVKTLLNITSTTKDAWIEALIPQVEEDYISIRNRPFDVGTMVTVETTGLAADEEITITIGNFAAVSGTAQGYEYDVRLRENDTASMITRRIKNQIQLSPYFFTKPIPVSSTSTSAEIQFIEKMEDFMENISVLDFTVTSTGNATFEVDKQQTFYPDGAEIAAAQMINFNLDKPSGAQSESLGDHSISYGDATGGYPKSITGRIRRYVRML